MNIDVIFSPVEYATLAKRNLKDTAVVVFDILRATSTIVTALQNGAKQIVPVAEIADALAIKQKDPSVLLAGERDGARIRAAQTDGRIEFDLGNSPREFIPAAVAGRTIVSTTTNGTRTIRACADAKMVLIGSFLNLKATAEFLRQTKFDDILLVCAGTGENSAVEDTLAAGALCEMLLAKFSDQAQIAQMAYAYAHMDLGAAVCNSANAKKLMYNPELRGDIGFCLRRDVFDLVAVLGADGTIDALVK